jgi:light-regulated signal transduction histidine kinase (bacteriophytochrome)
MSSNASRDDLLRRIGKLEAETAILRQSEQELRDFAKSLEQHNRDLQDFVYITAHDLQEPLHLIQAFGERLNTRYGNSLSDHGRRYLERIENTAARMQTLIQGLLLYSKATTETQTFVDTDLAVIINEVLTDLEVRLEQSGARVEVGHLPVIVADPLQMRQLFQNLIGNALKFRQEDRQTMVKISCQRLPPEKNDREYLQICVQDNGIGFDKKYKQRIFNIFQRLHNHKRYEGTGIGLTTCKMIVERHAGTIQATGEPGNGAVFTITLPLLPQQEVEETTSTL